MKILHAIPSLEAKYGGPSQSTASLVRALAQHESIPAEVFLLNKFSSDEVAVGSKIARFDIEFIYDRYWVPSSSGFKVIRRAVYNADIVHVHSYWNIFASVVIHMALAAGCPVVLSPRGVLHRDAIAHSSRRIKKAFALAFGESQLGRISGFHFQSENEAQNSVMGTRSVPPPKIVIDNGVEIHNLEITANEARRRTVGRMPGDVHLLFFGRLNRIKGIRLQLAALQRLRASGIDAKLHLVGPDDGELIKLQELAEQLDLKLSLYVHGPIYGPEKFLWLRGADGVLMSSDFENNSNAALEVMASGGALVATPNSVSNSAVEFGAVLCVEPTAEGLEGGIRQVTNEPAISAALRSQAVRFVREQHGWSSRATRMYSFYRTFL